MKKTPWFSGKAKPVYKGVYERKYSPHGNMFCYWNGEIWSMGFRATSMAFQKRSSYPILKICLGVDC